MSHCFVLLFAFGGGGGGGGGGGMCLGGIVTDLSPPCDSKVSLSNEPPRNKRTSLDRPVGCPSTTVSNVNKTSGRVFSKTSVERFRAVQIELSAGSHVVLFTSPV